MPGRAKRSHASNGKAHSTTSRAPSVTHETNGRRKEPGRLVIIGGHEDRKGDKLILRALAAQTHGRGFVVVTAASNEPDALWKEYRTAFHDLGVKDVRHLHVDSRNEALDEKVHGLLDGASTVFFTGGDQLKLTSQLGDTPVFTKTRTIYEKGGTVGGTSAGASVMCETMLVSGESSSSPKVNDALSMAPGFGLIPGIIIDQHFAERGRIGRLIGAVAQNPRIVGIGVDENTAIICQGHRCFTVLGDGGVYILDARNVSNSNVVEDASDRTLSVFDIKLHLLNMGDEYDLEHREPRPHPADEAEEAVQAKRR